MLSASKGTKKQGLRHAGLPGKAHAWALIKWAKQTIIFFSSSLLLLIPFLNIYFFK